jgi:hypothetical protein
MARGKPFEKGNKLGGRHRVPDDVKEALRALTPRGVERLAEMLESADEKIAIQAVKEVLDRNLGKPRQPVDVTDMTDDEIRAELKRIVRESGLETDEAEEATH